MLIKKTFLAAPLLAAMVVAQAQTVPDSITVAGGFTPIPLMIKAGEQWVSKSPQYKPPHILYNDTTVGFELFCAGNGLDTPSINTGTRAMRPAELELCAKNGVNEIVQFKLGHDALVAAQSSSKDFTSLSRKELFLAIAKEVPDPKDSMKLIPNPYRTWKEINATLPSFAIRVLAPEPKVGLYQAFLTGILLDGCKKVESIKALETSDPTKFEAVCKATRKDQAFVEYSKTPDVVKELKANAEILGIVSLTAVVKEKLKVIPLDNTDPTFVAVSREMYNLAFPMMVFVKKAHVALIPGLKDYLEELTAEAAIGTMGYFYGMGVIPLPLEERKQVRADVQALKVMTK